ncbi:MAG: hypothetical protein ACRDZP_02915 [Acidimicrobiales bacterium]
MTDVRPRRPAFYAAAPGSRWRDWWTVLHPPYTAWHLSYVVVGAALAPRPSVVPLAATLIAFFLAVGVAAHVLDELHGRPLGTAIPKSHLLTAAAIGLAGAIALGIAGVARQGPVLIPFIVVGGFLVVAYNAELFGKKLHNDVVFAAAWGAFPVLTAYAAEARSIGLSAVLAAVGAFGFSTAQRSLSTPARLLRRSAESVEGWIVLGDGTRRRLDDEAVLQPLERALRALSWSLVLLAAALAFDRLG